LQYLVGEGKVKKKGEKKRREKSAVRMCDSQAGLGEGKGRGDADSIY